MALVKCFEDLDAWKQARSLTKRVYLTTKVPRFATDAELVDQIRRAAVSCMNNLAEGFDSGGRIEFKRFLRYAVRSVSEVQSCLYVALDQGYLDRKSFDELYLETQSTRRLCLGLIRYLKEPK